MTYSEYIHYNIDPAGRTRFYGTYLGIVTNATDLEGRNRVEVKVPQISGQDILGWALPSDLYISTIALPSIGNNVWVTFQDGDASYPIWSSSSKLVATQGHYGAFSDYTDQYAGGATTLGAAVANQAAPLRIQQTDESNGISIVNNSRITFANVGTYNVQFSIQVENTDNADQDMYVWLKKNNTTNVAGSTGTVGLKSRKSTGDPYHTITGWNFVFTTSAPGDFYEFYWSTTSTGVSIQYYSIADNGSPTKPSTASVVLTVTPITSVVTSASTPANHASTHGILGSDPVTIAPSQVTGTAVTQADTGTVTSTMILDGTILNADINTSAAIVDTKLNTITTAGKVNVSAITGTLPVANGGTGVTTSTGSDVLVLNTGPTFKNYINIDTSGSGYNAYVGLKNSSGNFSYLAPNSSSLATSNYFLPLTAGNLIGNNDFGTVSDGMLTSGVSNAGLANKIVKTDSTGSISAIGNFYTAVGSITAVAGTITGKILACSQEINISAASQGGSGTTILSVLSSVGSGVPIKIPKNAGTLSSSGDTNIFRISVPTAANSTTTLTGSALLNSIITSTASNNPTTLTLPTGTNMETTFSSTTGYSAATNQAFDWSIINTGSTNSVVVAANTAHTTVGNLTVLPNTSGQFTSIKTTTNTYVTYRIS